MHLAPGSELRELLGAGACALAPRAVRLEHSQGNAGVVRVSCRRAALDARDRERLERASIQVGPSDRPRWSALFARSTLGQGAQASPALALLAAASERAFAGACAPRIVGVLNVTPDSFSDGGLHLDPEAALSRAHAMVAQGADWIDVGGESTRPGALAVEASEEIARVVPVIEALAQTSDVRISIDTTKAAVAACALEAGAHTINDVSAGRLDPELLPLAAERGCGLVLMHMAGTPRDMQSAPHYEDVLDEVAEDLRARAAAALGAGVRHEDLWLDPGIGFGKTLQHNLELLAGLDELRSLGLPLFLGVSRKSFIGQINAAAGLGGESAESRLGGTAAAVAACVDAGVEALRVHDVAVMAEAARVAHARVLARTGTRAL